MLIIMFICTYIQWQSLRKKFALLIANHTGVYSNISIYKSRGINFAKAFSLNATSAAFKSKIATKLRVKDQITSLHENFCIIFMRKEI